MGDLSSNFNRSEFADPTTGQADIDLNLVSALEELRALAGAPIHIDSGFRSPAHNAAVGGVQDSQHVLGKAADIRIDGMTVFEMYLLAEQIDLFRNGGIGVYDGGFIHVDVRAGRARWARVKGTYVAISEIVNGMKESA